MRSRLLFVAARTLCAATAIFAFGACAATKPPSDPLVALRELGAAATDGERVGRWLLGELVVPGGDAARAVAARKRLDGLDDAAKKGLYAALARAFDDEAHGRFRDAAKAHLDALAAAQGSPEPDAPLVAWYASNRLLGLRASVADLWAKSAPVVVRLLDDPGNIGFRARGELVEWWVLDGGHGATPGAGTAAGTANEQGGLEGGAARFGCVKNVRMAGPFGHASAADQRVNYDAERAGPWPAVFPRDPLRLESPRIRKVERVGCSLRAEGGTPGIYYLETFVDLPGTKEVIVAVQGAVAIFVDDTEVLTRDTRQWGIWPRFAAHVRLEGGRHRVLARVAGPETSIRLQTERGLPLGLDGSSNPAPPYALVPPEVLQDPNVLDPFLVAVGVTPQLRTPRPRLPRDTDDSIARMLAAYLAHVEGQDDLSAVLLDPLVKDEERATGPALAMKAVFLEKDPVFPPSDAVDLMKAVRARAVAKDGELWGPRFWLALNEADKAGPSEALPRIVELADHFLQVPDIVRGLAGIYARLEWKVEHRRTVRLAAERFPDDVEALVELLRIKDEEGEAVEAEALVARIRALDPDSEVDFARAISRRDYQGAIRELERLGAARKDRRDVARRVAEVLTRAGRSKESLEQLEAAVQKKPLDGEARLALADARFARGDRGALERAVVDAIHHGAEPGALRDAGELVDGVTELSPYRIDGRRVIAQFEAQKPEMTGTAARVLDYSAIWIHADGSARMLEHEILAIKEREGIKEQAEQRPRGMVLKIRTIKRDGRVLEPEVVAGKETVTMPHLEVGDYIETETISTLHGDGHGGQRFEGPRWFFREEKIPYWRSEFITVSPKNRPLDIETGGAVPKPVVTESGALVIRRWRVDHSPALPEEPASAPIQEFLPNIRIGWGINLKDTVARMIDAASDDTPRDPRLVALAATIGRGETLAILNGKTVSPDNTPSKGVGSDATPLKSEKPVAPSGNEPSIEDRARRIYRWVLANIEPGRETDGRRIVMGKSGVRTDAFLYLCRLNGIGAQVGLIRDRLAAPPTGPMSEVETFRALAVRLTTEHGPRWMVVRDKFAPYGYMPSSFRGQPAIVLTPGTPHEVTPTTGSEDSVTHEGTVELSADGSARLDIEQRYEGKLAILLRTGLEQLPEARFKETIEARLVPQFLPGARVLSATVANLAQIDEPLVLHMKLEMSSFARPRAGDLVIPLLFPLHLGSLTALPSRETPLYISEGIATKMSLRLRIKLPPGARVTTPLDVTTAEDDGRSARINDRIDGGDLLLDRTVDLPAGRIQPAGYGNFQAFARRVDAVLHRDVSVTLGGALNPSH